ncbi:MAG: DmsC/YnfH family molybdoenzyme membrane anchor subunit [Gammaproteobacteria bacterium]
MFEVRADEPKYAFLWDKETRDKNLYGDSIETVSADDLLRDKSLTINGDDAVGENPNRYKQHGFYFNADNCIACHACEAACSEKNDNPGHIAFRSVGFVEGGTYPAYQRLNISMACNHCDDPVCLKGCPTRAYTKFAEYGAVLQDPDICFGCGYCTWVCPYNAPQLDPVKGEVSKCNMCVDRLEVGLKPACVSACLGNALDFGVIENVPDMRVQSKTEIPGFPRADITHPNIRFQQTKATPREMTRTDSAAVKYHRNDTSQNFESVLDQKNGKQRHWGLSTLLSSHENAHVMFTLTTQAVMGAFVLLIAGRLLDYLPAGFTGSLHYFLLLGSMVVLMGFGLFKLTMHLGKPHRFYRGFNNLRLSPVSREIAGVSLFFSGLVAYALFALFDHVIAEWLGRLAAGAGILGVMAGSYFMYRLYRIPARPFWNHWQTGSAFYGTLLSFGSIFVGLFVLSYAPGSMATLLVFAGVAAFGLLLEGVGHVFHSIDLQRGEGEAAAAYYQQITQYGKTWLLRNGLLCLNLLAVLCITWVGVDSPWGLIFAIAWLFSMLVMAYLGRILFYALVIPTTMPGAFFWKNKGFVDHARESGLADMQQLGVVYEQHHAFDWRALLKTVRETNLTAIVTHIRWIMTGK